jgi:uncharacterized protein
MTERAKKSMKTRAAIMISVLVVGMCSTGLSAAEKLYSGKVIKVLHVTGGGAHDYKTQSTLIPELIKARGDFKIDVIGPDWAVAKTELKKAGWSDGYDIVVYNICDAFNADKALIDSITKVHTEGTTPAVIIHGSLHSFHWKMGKDKAKFEGEEWIKVVGIASANHGRRAPITVKTVKPDHPIMKGLPKEWKTPAGELYNSNDVLPSTTALAMGDNGNAKQGPQVCIWVNKCGESKVFGTSIGHHSETIATDIYGDMLVRGLLWACDKL